MKAAYINKTPLYLLCVFSLIGLAVDQYKEFNNEVYKATHKEVLSQKFTMGKIALHLDNANGFISFTADGNIYFTIEDHEQFIKICKKTIK